MPPSMCVKGRASEALREPFEARSPARSRDNGKRVYVHWNAASAEAHVHPLRPRRRSIGSAETFSAKERTVAARSRTSDSLEHDLVPKSFYADIVIEQIELPDAR